VARGTSGALQHPVHPGVNSGGASIAVVGRGPVGLAAAVALARAGYAVTLIGPRAPRDERTAALLGASVALLERLGVWDGVVAQSAPLKALRIVDGTRRLFRAPEVTFDADEIGLEAFGHNVPNALLTAALEDVAARHAIRMVDGFAEGATITAKDAVIATPNGDVAAALIVAADGRRSRMRDAAGIGVEEWRYDQAALVCNLRHAEPHDDTSTEFHTEAGPFTLVPLPGNRSSLVLVARPAEAERLMALDDHALAVELEQRSAAILGTITIDGRRAMFPLSGMRARSLAAKRTVLAGEAAHVLPPIGAQGLNLGFRDVAALAELLVDPDIDPGGETILAEYRRARQTDVIARSTAVDALNRILLSDFLPVQALRSLGLSLIGGVAPLRRFAMRRGIGA
jgi:2-octaprenyl-6-methoxyphenol hydroxylase